MNKKYWLAIIEEEDRIISNSDRRFRYHCYSLESMSEELTYQERSLFIQNDFTTDLFVEDFIDTVQNKKLADGLRHLPARQRRAMLRLTRPTTMVTASRSSQMANPA